MPPPTMMKSTKSDRSRTGCYPNIRDFMNSAGSTPPPDAVRVSVTTASRAYVVSIANGAIDHLRRTLAELKLPERRFVVSSPLVWRLHGPQLARALGAVEPILVPDGERFKLLATVTRVYDALLGKN